RDPLRSAAAAACRALGVRLRADAKAALHPSEQSSSERAIAVAQAEAASSKLDTTFLATPYRPTGLSSAARAIVRLVDEIAWLHALLDGAPPHGPAQPANEELCAVKRAAAQALEHGADLLDDLAVGSEPLDQALADLERGLARVERGGTRSSTSDL